VAGQKGLRIELKYFEGAPAIPHLARVSKPGRRVYSGSKELPVIRNGQSAKKDSILTPASKLRANVLDVLQREGYIRGYSEEQVAGQKGLRIELKYFEGAPAIQHLARVSKPGRRVYSGSTELPRIRNGLGTVIVSTPRGVLSDAEAREQNVGGEVLAEVF
jgi:small subunit ribosomal protein S8